MKKSTSPKTRRTLRSLRNEAFATGVFMAFVTMMVVGFDAVVITTLAVDQTKSDWRMWALIATTAALVCVTVMLFLDSLFDYLERIPNKDDTPTPPVEPTPRVK